MSDPLRVNLLLKNIRRNTTVYLDGIENPVKYQNVSEEGKETTGICLWTYSLKHTEVLLATSLCEGWKSYKERLYASYEEVKIK